MGASFFCHVVHELRDNWKLALGTSAAIVSGVAAGSIITKLLQSESSSATPKKWVRVGTVSHLTVYPVKSCQGIMLEKGVATTIGLKGSEFLRDRVFMVVDARYVFQTQRTIPTMALIKTEIKGSKLVLSAKNAPSIAVEIPKASGMKKSCRIFDDKVPDVLDCGDEVGKWLDDFLGKTGLRLVYHQLERTQREMTPLQKKFPTFVPSDKGAFQDQTSFMLMSSLSIQELNKHLETKVSHRNFRPTILIKDAPEAYAEDFWGFVKIGEKGPIFKAAKPCTRCKLTTVDPDKGAFIPSGEPLSKLTKMPRSMGNEKVDALVKNQGILGLQLGLFEGNGKEISVGDPVYAAVL